MCYDKTVTWCTCAGRRRSTAADGAGISSSLSVYEIVKLFTKPAIVDRF